MVKFFLYGNHDFYYMNDGQCPELQIGGTKREENDP